MPSIVPGTFLAQASSSVGTGPLYVLAIGIAIVLGLIIFARANAFLALIAAAFAVSLLAPGGPEEKIGRVANAFGNSAGSIGIVIALAAIIGKCMLDSGAADRVVRAFTGALGEKRGPLALMGSGYFLAIPVFFDTVFYLLVPLARSLHRKTGKNYLKYILAISVGGALTHTLVPPTPGPLMMAAQLQIDLGLMMIVGAAVALPAAFVGLLCCGYFDARLDVPMRQIGNEPEPEPLEDSQLPSLFWAVLPVILPVLMISTNTILTTAADSQRTARLSVNQVNWDALSTLVTQAQSGTTETAPQARVVQRVQSLLEGEAETDGAASLLELTSWSDQQRSELVEAMNESILVDKAFYDKAAFLGILLSPETDSLLGQRSLRMKISDAEHMNRLLLQDAWGDAVTPVQWNTPLRRASNWADLFGNANLALFLSAIVAMGVLLRQRGLTFRQLAGSVETALMSGGIIILITAGGGAFGKMLETAQVGTAIQELFQLDGQSGGMMVMVLGFGIAVVLKIAQGSSTVAMITGSSMLAGIAVPETLGFNPVYLATAIGGGSLVGSWMNDSGFWIFAKMGGLTEEEALKSWTPLLAIIGSVSFAISLLMARALPLI